MTTEEITLPRTTYQPKEHVAKPLSIAILERAIRDCVYIRRRDLKEFVSQDCVLKSTQLKHINKEKYAMIKFLDSELFEILCEIVGYDDNLMRAKIVHILKDNKAAEIAAEALGMKFMVPIILAIALMFFSSVVHAQPFVQLRPFIPLPINSPPPTVEVTVLDSVHTVKIPVKCKGKTVVYRVVTYTYLTPDNTKISYPFLVQGSDKAKHPITAKIKIAGRKVMLFAPFIEVGGALAQILLLFHI